MNRSEIKHYLEQMAGDMIALAGSLGAKGQEPTQQEKDLIRMSIVPAIQEMNHMILTNHMMGQDSVKELERLQSLLDF